MISIGKYSYACNPNILWKVDDLNVTCGKFVSIAENVTIFLGNGIGHDSSFVTTFPFGEIHKNTFPDVKNNSKNTNGSITIGNDVWIGYGSTIMSGLTIGNGSIIAANSHVVKSVEPYSIVGGNPAKHIKYRFSPEQIKNLLEIKWWDWSECRINKYMDLMLSNDIDKFIKTALSDDACYFLVDEVDYSLIDEIMDFPTDGDNNYSTIEVTDDAFIEDVEAFLPDENSSLLNSENNNDGSIDKQKNDISQNSTTHDDLEIIQDIKELINDIIIYIEA